TKCRIIIINETTFFRTGQFLIFIFNMLLSAVVRADIYKFSFLFLTSTLVFQSGCGYGLKNINSGRAASPTVVCNQLGKSPQ
ncbi:MAG: hypothetical protein WKF85_11315, partial [Chitinophagaceae bacterium]